METKIVTLEGKGMTIKTRASKLEDATGSGGLSSALRAWLGEPLSPAEHQQDVIEDAQPLPDGRSKFTQEKLQWSRT